MSKLNNSVDISIVIVSWNTCDLISDCIKSIFAVTKGVAFEIIVVDNASSDNTVTSLRKQYPQITVIAQNTNDGFSKANNVGIKASHGRNVLLLNPDTFLKEDAISMMSKFLDDNSAYGAVGCRLLNRDGSIQYQCARTYPTAWNQFCFLSMLEKLFPKNRLFASVELKYWDHRESRDIDCISGACICSTKRVLSDLNGFDENIFMYTEDVDLCYRIRMAGLRIRYLADSSIFHYHGASSIKQTLNYFSLLKQKDSQIYFLKKHKGLMTACTYRVAVFVGALIRIGSILPAIMFFVFINKRGKIDGLTKIIKKYWVLFLWASGLKKTSRK